MRRIVRLVCGVTLCVVGWYSAVGLCDEAQSGAAKVPDKPRSYKECVRAGGRIQESYPARCILESGEAFVQSTESVKSACKDLCGDGTCQEIVCMALGCPCPESPATCPADCS